MRSPRSCSPARRRRAAPVLAFDLQGHRGARGLAPENTIAAFKRALDIGVTTIETDLGITRDGVVVIAHDRRLNAALTRGPDGKWLTAAGPSIRSLSLAELKAYDVGRLDPASAYAKTWTQQVAADGERIPALTELFDLIQRSGKPVRLNLETKLSPNAPDETVDPATFARAVVDAVRKAGFAARTTLQSFDWRTLVEAKRLAPEIRTACLTTEGGNGDTVKPDAQRRLAVARRAVAREARRLGAEARQGGRLRHLVAVLAQRHARTRARGSRARPRGAAVDGQRAGRHGNARSTPASTASSPTIPTDCATC